MREIFWDFLRADNGQDMVEYALLLAFVLLASAALFLGTDHFMAGIWGVSSSQLSYANSITGPS
jgi:Flp pilus assembly pilin Flp